MTTLDYAFAVAGDVIERDYPPGLYRALAALLPWLEDEPLAGVHPMRGLTPCPAGLLVGGRTRITLRVPEHRAEACVALQGADLQLASPLHIGRASRRELLPTRSCTPGWSSPAPRTKPALPATPRRNSPRCWTSTATSSSADAASCTWTSGSRRLATV